MDEQVLHVAHVGKTQNEKKCRNRTRNGGAGTPGLATHGGSIALSVAVAAAGGRRRQRRRAGDGGERATAAAYGRVHVTDAHNICSITSRAAARGQQATVLSMWACRTRDLYS